MSGESATVALHPQVLWAQRNNCVFVTVNLSDVKDELVNVEPARFAFEGKVDGDSKKNYAVEFDFFAEVDPNKVTRDDGDRVISLCIEKKEPAVWPRLLRDDAKPPWLKTDFNKWKDLDDSGSDGEGGFGGNSNFEEMLSMMNNKGLDGLDDDDGNEADADSDDEDLPDLEEPQKDKEEEEEEVVEEEKS